MAIVYLDLLIVYWLVVSRLNLTISKILFQFGRQFQIHTIKRHRHRHFKLSYVRHISETNRITGSLQVNTIENDRVVFYEFNDVLIDLLLISTLITFRSIQVIFATLQRLTIFERRHYNIEITILHIQIQLSYLTSEHAVIAKLLIRFINRQQRYTPTRRNPIIEYGIFDVR